MIPRVAMIGSGYDGCNYYRIMLPAWHNGFFLDRPTLAHPRGSIDEIKALLDSADIVVFHRPESQEYHDLADILKDKGKKIVMDNDDTFKLDDIHPLARFKPDGKWVKKLNERDDSIDRFIEKADLVTTTTNNLAYEYMKLNNNVRILPNYIDPMEIDTVLKNTAEKVRIGMVGSVSYEYDYLHLKPLLRELSERDDVSVVMFGLGSKEHREQNPLVTKAFKEEYKFWDNLNIEHIPWCQMNEYYNTLNKARLDLMLIPRKENYFNRCKSNIKFLEAALLEIPCIAQSFEGGPYEEIEDFETGIKVKDNSLWKQYVNELIAKPELRRKIGKQANEYALKKYNIEDHAGEWARAYSLLL